MRKSSLSLFVIFSCLYCFSQQRYKVSYVQLKAFEGLYEYTNHTTLKIAASPKDTLLYAVINESRYKLVPSDKDQFLDMTNNKIQFYRNKSNAIAGYILNNDTFKLVSKNIFFPKSIWYPRLNAGTNFKYVYKQPKVDKDGLVTASIVNSGLDASLLSVMMGKIIDGTYPNVHSVLIVKDDKLVFEEYFYEYNKDVLHELRSATKSFVSALTGIAIDKKFISGKENTVLPYFPEYSIANITEPKNR
jgi:hypothetical protein